MDSLRVALLRRGAAVVRVAPTPRGAVLDVEGLPALGPGALRALAREAGLEGVELTATSGPWNDGGAGSSLRGARQRLRARRAGAWVDARVARRGLGPDTLARLQAVLDGEPAGVAAAALGLVPDAGFPGRFVDRLGRSWAPPRDAEAALAIVLEHLGGALPTWLAPEQVRLLPIVCAASGGTPDDVSSRLAAWSADVAHLRVTVVTDGALAARVGAATAARVPYLVFVGPDEVARGVVRVRARGGRGARAQAVVTWPAFVDHVTEEARARRPSPQLPQAASPALLLQPV